MAEVDGGDGIGPSEPIVAAARRDPCVYTVTVRVAPYVAQFEDGRQEAVAKHDVIFQIDIANGLTFAKFHQKLVEHMQMGPGQVVHLFALDKNSMTVEPILCGEELVMHFIGAHRDFENKVSFMWPAARAYRPQVFNYHMNKVIAENPEVDAYLKIYHNLKWMRCMFDPSIKCDYINNNLAESFNAWIRDYKDLPVDELADTIREMIMKLFHKRRRIGVKLRGRIIPAVIQQIFNRTRGLQLLKVGKSGNGSCEVKDLSKHNLRHVVKVDKKECTCLEWQHTGKPCDHALAFLIGRRNPIWDEYVDNYFSLDKFREAYAGEIEPLTDRSQWPHVEMNFDMQAPIDKPRGSGRPRKLRFKGFLEGGDGGPKKKKEPKRLGSQNRCKRCNELGHRQSTCPLNGPKKRQRKKRARRYPSDDEDTANPQNVESTPKRQMITIPASLQGSPSPITRRRLAIALAEEEASQLAAPTVDTMMLTIPASLQGSPSPITRRRLAIALADEEPSQPAVPSGTMMMSVDMSSSSKARKLTPKRRKMA